MLGARGEAWEGHGQAMRAERSGSRSSTSSRERTMEGSTRCGGSGARARLRPAAMPRALQTAIWSRQAQWMLEQSRARFGDMFTIKIAHEGTWVMLADPELVKQVFTGDPQGLPRRRGQPDPAARSSATTRSSSSTRSRTSASAGCCCRPSTASACRATARRWPRSPPARSRAGPPAPPTSCGRGCRRSPWRSSSRPSSASTTRRGWTRCGRRCATSSTSPPTRACCCRCS